MQFFLIATYFLAIFLAIYLSKKYQIEWRRVLTLMILPPILFGVIVIFFNFFISFQEDDLHIGIILSAILSIVYSFLFMLPSLMMASVSILIVEKKLHPKPMNLFLWAVLIGGLSSIIPAMLMSPIFIVVAMITGVLAVIFEHYYLGGAK